MDKRIGVFVCHCGTNIAGKVDVVKVAEYAKSLPGVVVAREYRFMCSDPGQELIRNDIAEQRLNRVVIAACSPRMHEGTFRKTVERAGINRYFLQIANIREHVSWPTEDPEAATQKAMDMVRAAVARVPLHASLRTDEVPVNREVMVVGAGIGGIQAALDIADGGYKVHLVERLPSVGGHMAQYDKVFPTLDCAACIGTPKMVAVGMHERIRLHTYSEVDEVSGFVGQFKVKVRHKAAYVNHDVCTGCGMCQEKCPKKVPSEFHMKLGDRKAIYTLFAQAVPNKPVIDRDSCIYFQKGKCRACEKFCEMKAIDFEQQDRVEEIEVGSIVVATGFEIMDPSIIEPYGYGRYPNVFTGLEFERMVQGSGPTMGKIQGRDGTIPKDVAILHCVGSRDLRYHEYCSRVCCMYGLKHAHQIREKIGANVYMFYIDMRCFGKGYEEFYNRVQNEGVVMIRGKASKVSDQPVLPEDKGRLIVTAEDTASGEKVYVPVDMVLLSSAMEPRPDAQKTARVFNISRSKDGFFLEQHPKLGPVNTAVSGIFLAGTCQGPKDVVDTVGHAAAAASKALSLASKGVVEMESIVSSIDPEVCAGCKSCVSVCPANAITFNERRGISVINEAVCLGCGSCAATCPSGAAGLKHFTPDQVLTEIEALMGA
ncbi:MAG: CoB--CoM heterodisulfide reductase iron-sulfur subunit A family protein [Desulfobacteraceae bacterium]|nr:MAG: CoB--CoM heterodisulfide reductase iron-sulfur subunit A family protein [Desulfobacteraceae bacterium]